MVSKDKTITTNNPELNELERLYEFMKKYRIDGNKKYSKDTWTHSLTYIPYGSYRIPDSVYGKFKRLYEDAIVAGYTTHITERHREFGPIVIDFDFVQSKEHPQRYYTEKTISNIIKSYNKIARKYLDVSDNSLISYVLEKKKPSLRKGEYHDGIHVVYPYVCTKPSLQLLMREEFIKLAEKKGIFDKIPHINDLESIFDKGVIYHVGWMMYGSVKNNNSYPYNVTHIFVPSGKYIHDTSILGNNTDKRSSIRHFIDVLSCRRFFSEKSLTDLADDVDPQAIDEKILNIREKISKEAKSEKDIVRVMGSDITFIKSTSDDQLEEAKTLVKMLSEKRASYYYTWYQVGKCLHNIDNRLLIDWIEFSKRTSRNNFKKGECELLWKKMKASNYTIASLHFFASQDSPKEYSKMREEKLESLIRDGLLNSHHTIAKFVMEKYKFLYRCASIKHNIWFEFKEHRWVEIDSAYTLRNRISDDISIAYMEHQKQLYDSIREKKGYEKEQSLKETERISKVIHSLNNNSFKNGIIRECADLAYDPKFLRNLDENIYLICFENGVYDLEGDFFRDGCPDDYVSLCTNYKYVEYDKNDETSKEIKNFFRMIQPDKVMRHYLLTLLSTCLAGSICEESFYVLTGSGSNGKSKMMELLKHSLGDLFKPMDIQLLVCKRSSSSSATPEIADKKGIRACPFDEPRATDEINTGFMKLFTGGDVIMGRALYKEPVYFKPQFKSFLLCNNLPNIRSDDDGTWRRIKVIPFPSKFVCRSKCKKLGKNQFWRDKSLSEKLIDWKEMFIGLLLRYYRKYRSHGLIHPKIVTQETEAYRRKCDVYQDFLGDYLEKTDDKKDLINTTALHEAMRSWYRANYEGKCPGTKELRIYLSQRVSSFNPKTDILTGYRIKSENDSLGDLNEIN